MMNDYLDVNCDVSYWPWRVWGKLAMMLIVILWDEKLIVKLTFYHLQWHTTGVVGVALMKTVRRFMIMAVTTFFCFFWQQTKTFVILTTVFLHPNLSSGTLNPTIPIPLHLIFLCRMLNGIEVTFLSLTIQKWLLK